MLAQEAVQHTKTPHSESSPVSQQWGRGAGSLREGKALGTHHILAAGMLHRSVPVGVIFCKGVQVSHLAQAALNVCNVDFHIILKATDIRNIYCTLDIIQ